MTKHEAIEDIEKNILPIVGGESLKMAIETLKAQSWIPCSVRLPKKGDWYLGVFKENDTGWVSPIPQVCRYVGDDTGETTKDGWLLRNVDKNTFGFAYYRKLECVAWMPLPEPYSDTVRK